MSAMKQSIRRKRGAKPFQAYDEVVKQTVHQLRVSKRVARQTFGVGWQIWRGARGKLAEIRDAKPRGRPKGWRKMPSQGCLAGSCEAVVEMVGENVEADAGVDGE